MMPDPDILVQLTSGSAGLRAADREELLVDGSKDDRRRDGPAVLVARGHRQRDLAAGS